MNPNIVKYFTYPVHEWLKGKKTLSVLNYLENTQWMEREKIKAIQLKKLKQLILYVYDYVPYYRRLFDELRTKPDDIQSLSDFSSIPVLTKDTIRYTYDELISTSFKERRISYTTGGSTGEPLKFLVDNHHLSNEWGANWRARRWWGVDIGSRMLAFWASPIEASTQSRIKTLRDWLLNNRVISAIDIRPEKLKEYLHLIRKHRADYLFGYSSIIYSLAMIMRDKNIKFNSSLKAIFTTADTLFDYQRELIEEVFNAPVGIEYGARDGGFIAHECPYRNLHIFEEGMLVEIVDSSGKILPDNNLGDIVLTILDSRIMPFLRYKIGDMGMLASEECPCGVKLKILSELMGRRCDNLLKKDGSIVHGAALANILITNSNIQKYQIIQNNYNRFIIKLVEHCRIPDAELRDIRKGFQIVFGETVDLEFKKVEKIAPAASGKHCYIINELL